MAKRSERDRYKYGVCTNRDKDGKPCPKCDNKEIQKVRMGQDFVCEECKEPMRQVPPPKSSTPKGKVIGIIATIIIIFGCIATYLFVFNKSDNPPVVVNIEEELIVKPDSTLDEQSSAGIDSISKSIELEDKDESIIIPPPVTKATVSVKGGSYIGQVKNEKQPHGQGTLTYNSRTRISMRDMKERYAEAGQYIIGEFYEGELVQGKLFDKDNEPIESIILGRPR